MDVVADINVRVAEILQVEVEPLHAAERVRLAPPPVHAHVHRAVQHHDPVKRFVEPRLVQLVEVFVPHAHEPHLAILAVLLVADDKRPVDLAVGIGAVAKVPGCFLKTHKSPVQKE